MKHRVGFLVGLIFSLVLVDMVSAKEVCAEKGFQVDGVQLLDSHGEVFVMRGVNIPHAWFEELTESSLKSAADFGCNTARVVLSNGAQWNKTPAEDLKQILQWCEANEMIAVVEVHDITGYGDKPLAGKPETAIAYWLEPEIQQVLKGTEAKVILNIANEPFGNKGSEQWFDFHVKAIQQLREAGYQHTFMVDAPYWGQDWKKLLLDKGQALLEVDPDHNTMFSVHMYEVYGESAVVREYLNTANEKGFCIIVGEFGMEHFGKPVAADAILETCDELNMGYLGWSWSGNGGGVEALDLVIDFDPEQLSPWGEFLFHHPDYGIQATAKKASVFE